MNTRIDLRKALRSSRITGKPLSTELAQINEFKKLKDTNLTLLKNVGLDTNFVIGAAAVAKMINESKDTVKFDEEEIYTLKEILRVCHKYNLKFLPSALYIGTIDPTLPKAMAEFEENYHIELFSWRKSPTSEFNYECDGNCFIMAPGESFVKIAPKDPMFFVEIAPGLFYLLKQWGNDLHWSRVLFNTLMIRIYMLVVLLIYVIALVLFWVYHNIKDYGTAGEVISIFLTIVVLCVVSTVIGSASKYPQIPDVGHRDSLIRRQ